MKKIKIILGSTRNGRHGQTVMNWFSGIAQSVQDLDLSFEAVDLKDWPLPFIENATPPSSGQYSEGLVTEWAKVIDEADGFVIITPEYNHGYSAVLKNALDVIYPEWNYKPVTFVSYGATSGGIRAVEQLKQVVLELKMYPLHEEVNIPHIWQAFVNGLPVDKVHNDKALSLLKTLNAFFKK